MTISAIAPRAAAAPPAPAPAPPKASDPMDFATIDTAEKALALPAFNALALASFSSVITACAMSGCGLHGSLAASIGQGGSETKMTGDYKLSPTDDGGLSMNCTGKIGGADFSDNWSYGLDEAIRMSGKFGNSEESLVLSTANGAARLSGHVGSVDVDLSVSSAGYDGTVGGQKVHIDTTMAADPKGLYSVTSKGTVGPAPLAFSGNVTKTADSKGIAVNGSGSLDGYQLSLSQTLIPELPSR